MNLRSLNVEQQSWPLENEFRISRGAKTQADILLVSITEDGFCGRAEAVPYNRYNETVESVIEQIESVREHIEKGVNIELLNLLLPAGAARNAVDCALWELEAKKCHSSVAKLTLMKPFSGCITAQTLSIDTPENMASAAKKLAAYPLIKIKFDQDLVLERMTAIHQAAPASQFIIDANEAWSIEQLNRYSSALKDMNVVLIEQPLAAQNDQDLAHYIGNIAICADESVHTSKDLDKVAKLYQYINIKLDKTGGLSEALKLLRKAQARRIGVMVGCMVGTSLAMAPATLLAGYADFVDLDGPALLKHDREHGFEYQQGHMSALKSELWGGYSPITSTDHADRQFRLFNRS